MAELRAQVEFHTIAKTYPTDAHIECRYTMKATHRPTTYDWIGLFKVGWSTSRDVIFYDWAPYPKDKSDDSPAEGSLLFQSSNLPKEDGEFYQFVYFNGKTKMCGASSPFQFRAPRSDDLIEEEMDDQDMLFITTRQVVLEEKLDQLEVERTQLSQTCTDLDKQNSSLTEQLDEAKNQMQALESEIERLRTELETLKTDKDEAKAAADQKLAESEEKYNKLKQNADALAEQREQIKATLTERNQMMVDIKNQLDECVGQVEALRKEKELYQSHSTAAENAKQQAMNELVILKQRLDENSTEKETIDMLQAQVNSSQETIECIEKEKLDLKQALDRHIDQIEAAEARQVVSADEISSLNETLVNLSNKVERVNMENSELKCQVTRYESEKKDWEKMLEDASKEKNSILSTNIALRREIDQLNDEKVSASVLEEQEDRFFTLQAAYGMLKDELRSTQSELDALKRKETRLKDADRQVKELQGKLKLGEEEWKKMYSQKVKAEKQLKNARSGSISDSETTPAGASGAAGDELTRHELQQMTEQLSKELELRTQKKDKYKQKYLDEKQRAATMRDYYKGELNKLTGDLELARGHLEGQFNKPLMKKGSDHKTPAVTPIVYPPVVPPTRRPQSLAGSKVPAPLDGPAVFDRQLSKSGSRGALEDSIVEDHAERHEPLTPLPAPMEPQKVVKSYSKEDSSFEFITKPVTPVTTEHQMSIPSTRKRYSEGEEPIVMTRQEDSDDDNEGLDRFHDAIDMPARCCVCEKVFDIDETVELRNAHVNMCLESQTEPSGERNSMDFHKCPMCACELDKSRYSEQYFQSHVDSHFPITN